MKLADLEPGDWFWHEKDGVKSRCMIIHPVQDMSQAIRSDRPDVQYVAVRDDGRMLDNTVLSPDLEVLPARGPRG